MLPAALFSVQPIRYTICWFHLRPRRRRLRRRSPASCSRSRCRWPGGPTGVSGAVGSDIGGKLTATASTVMSMTRPGPHHWLRRWRPGTTSGCPQANQSDCTVMHLNPVLPGLRLPSVKSAAVVPL